MSKLKYQCTGCFFYLYLFKTGITFLLLDANLWFMAHFVDNFLKFYSEQFLFFKKLFLLP